MRTPFDAALRLQQREVDGIRTQVGVALQAVVQIEQAGSALDDRMRSEREQHSEVWFPHADAWAAHMKAQRARLAQDRARAEDVLTALRAKAAEAYGQMRAIEGAAERHRTEQLREIESAEQAEADDIAATRFLAARRLRARRDAA